MNRAQRQGEQPHLIAVLRDLDAVLSLGTARLPADLDRRVLEVGCEGLSQHIHLQRDAEGRLTALPSPQLVDLARDLRHHALQGVP